MDAIRVLGRSDDTFKFRGALVTAEDVVRLAKEASGAREVQLHIVRDDGTDRLELFIAGEVMDPASVRSQVLSRSLDLKNLFDHDPDGFRVIPVHHLDRNPRTGKTPFLVRRPAE